MIFKIKHCILFAGLLSSCCWAAKRSCFPPCPPAPPAKIIKVEMPCKLPPPMDLPAVHRKKCPVAIENWICYPPKEAAKLAKRIASMRDWITGVKARCGQRIENKEH